MKQDTLFGRFAKKVAALTGHPATFLVSLSAVAIWALTGPVFQYSETWQLVINTGTTIITFLMVFIIQHTQNKDTMALQLKLDELIRANTKANNALMFLEDMSEEELNMIKEKYVNLAMEAQEHLREGTQDDQKPDATEDFGIAGSIGEDGKKSRPRTRRKAPIKKRAKKASD